MRTTKRIDLNVKELEMLVEPAKEAQRGGLAWFKDPAGMSVLEDEVGSEQQQASALPRNSPPVLG